MPFHIRDPETDTKVRELARRRGVGLTEAVHQAVGEALEREAVTEPLIDRVREIQQRIAARGRTGLVADKAFFDWLSGEEDE
ncbi:type II toxin-antitoxin system VapB family antitoxin [Phenylobacterium sp.]|jgi:antitoxin VapB|uniref:type II toxin-antitoxin system VapB family antitoxin n=1 Tax=Phenylobacterium sp. TaxID=1871053 RepID=UPI0037C6B8D3